MSTLGLGCADLDADGSCIHSDHMAAVEAAAYRAEHTEEHAMSTKYTAGWNMPGYLPESEPATLDTFNEAVAYLADTVSRFWDEDYDGVDGLEEPERTEARESVDGKWLPVHTDLHNSPVVHDDGTRSLTLYTPDTGLVFWIVPAPEDDTDADVDA